MQYELPEDGWLRLWRRLLKKRAWVESDPKHKVIFMTLLMMVNYEHTPSEWEGKEIVLKPGQMITSTESIKINAGKDISTQNVRSALDRFEKKYEFIRQDATTNGRFITVLNWREYQQQGQTNQQSESAIENAEKLYDYYLKKIQPGKKTRGIAIHNILKHSKKYSFKDLATAICNYAHTALLYEPEFRKKPSNFFGINEPYFKDFLPGKFQKPSSQKYECKAPKTLTAERLAELNA